MDHGRTHPLGSFQVLEGLWILSFEPVGVDHKAQFVGKSPACQMTTFAGCIFPGSICNHFIH